MNGEEVKFETRLKGHVPALDGLRGIAILLVLIFHSMPDIRSGWAARLAYARYSCWIGVELFFALSGFLITRILIDLRGRRFSARNFYARRVLRIFPIYYLMLIVVFFGFSHWSTIAGAISGLPSAHWFLLYGFNIWLGFHRAWPTSDLLNHFWSLSVEEQFYLVWPWLILFIPFRRLPYLMGGVAMVAVMARIWAFTGGEPWLVLYTGTVFNLDYFAFGGLAAWAFVATDWRGSLRVARITCIGAGLFLLSYAWVYHGFSLVRARTHGVASPVFACFFPSFIFLTVASSSSGARLWRGFLEAAPLRLLGKYSYGLYVYHWIVLSLLGSRTPFGLPLTNPWLTSSIVVALSVVLALVSFHLFEAPILRLKRHFV